MRNPEQGPASGGVETDELLALAKAATRGPWKLCHHLRDDATCPCGYRGGVWSGDGERLLFEMGGTPEEDGTMMTPTPSPEQRRADAAFIVACSPERITALCAELTALRARVEAAERDTADVTRMVEELTRTRTMRDGSAYVVWDAHLRTDAIGSQARSLLLGIIGRVLDGRRDSVLEGAALTPSPTPTRAEP